MRKSLQMPFEERRYGYLRDTDTIIFNTAQRVEVALKRAKYEAETNYIPNPRHQIYRFSVKTSKHLSKDN